MKQPKRATRVQKEIIRANRLNPANWMIIAETDFYLKIMNKESGKTKMITRFPGTK